jgi:bifunctional non-homologous end joining protein LigD
VIQEHDASTLHWDLRLERDGVLVSWAIPKGLPEAPGENHFAAHTEDHPLDYAGFSGRIPKGQYGAGTVSIWDSGTYDCLKWEPRKIEVALKGRRVRARYALFAIGSGGGRGRAQGDGEEEEEEEEEDGGEWMIHRMDPPADATREPMPDQIEPMLARAGPLPGGDGQWAYEIKWDGVRALAHSRPGRLRLTGRRLNDISAQYPELGRLGRALGSHSAILDGEIVTLGESGRPSFAALQRRMHVGSPAQAKRLARSIPVAYMIFDLLWLDGHPLLALPYAERREQLAALELSGERWQTPEHFLGSGPEVLAASAEQGLEGIVAKRLDSTYDPGRRSPAWIKVKNSHRQEFVIGGWIPEQGRASERIGSLLIGVHDGPALLRAGRVGTGFTHAEAERLARLLAPLRSPTSPFATGGPAIPRGAIFTRPELVAEVEFSEWTAAGSLRHPSYKGLRDDKPAALVVREQAHDDRAPGGGAVAGRARKRAPKRPLIEEPATGPAAGVLAIEERGEGRGRAVLAGHELQLSNLDKVLYPKGRFSKRDVIDYYAAIAPLLLAHLHDRPLTVTRWPDGVEGHSFFQKQAPAHRPGWVRTATLPSQERPIDYLLAQDLPTLVWLANLAALELHTPLARARSIERPTALVFDLDPGPPATVIDCCHVALALHGMFEQLGLQCFAKTSGLKGLQVYLPLNSPRMTYERTKPFARTVARLLEREEPDRVVSRMSRAHRQGRVLIDWSQNDRRKTTVCVYSLRAGQRPTVSAPVRWEEVARALDSGDPRTLQIEAPEALRRAGQDGDLFAPVLSLTQKLPAL